MDYRQFPQGYILRVDPGEEIVAAVTALAKREELWLANITALGAARDVTLGIFSTDEKQYHSRRYQGDYEIASLVGSVTRREGEPYLHLHAVIANPQTGEIHGGHLNNAVVSATAEIFLQVWEGRIGRGFSEEVGLNLLEF